MSKNRFITERMPEAQYVAQLGNFKTVIDTRQLDLGLTPAQAAAIEGACTAAQTRYESWLEIQRQLEAVKELKDTQFESTRTTVNLWAQIFRANPAISDELIALLNLAPRRPTRVRRAPVTPTNFVGRSTFDGLVTLTWRRNGNTTSTLFVVQARFVPNGPWTDIGSVSQTKFTYQAQVGAFVQFRVLARKRNETAPPTPSVAFWSDGDSSAALFQKAA